MTRKRSFFAVMLSIAMILGGLVLPSINTGSALTAEASSEVEYHAYLYFWSNYSARYPCDDEYYGLYGSLNTDEITYNVIHTWDYVLYAPDTNAYWWGLTSSPGTFTDVTITGDGTYTVSVSGLEWDEDKFSDSDGLYELLGISTALAWAEAEITIDKVVIDDTVFNNPEVYEEDEETNYIRLDVENYSNGVSVGGYDATSSSNISITFTVSGLPSMNNSLNVDISTVTESDELTPTASYNVGNQNYNNWSTRVYSYLVNVDSGVMRVEYNGTDVVVEYYDSDYTLVDKKYVTAELPRFGAFYAGEDAYYLVFGQNNPDEDDSVEVIRVVKYSKDWERLGNASLYGANTYIPFDAGSCRLTEYDGYLYIRTCHEMYESSDGLHHQANLTIVVREISMSVIASSYDVDYNTSGYAGHSFNQFILVDDDGYMVAAEHCDAYPRAAAVFKNTTKAGLPIYMENCDYVEVFPFEYVVSLNYTGASVGGFEYSSSSYLVAGNSVDQDEDYDFDSARNIFVGVVSRADVSETGITVNWITDYSIDGDTTTSTPQLVKMGDDTFLLLWTISVYDSETYTYTNKLNYVFLDGKGNTTSDIYEVDGQLSDCQPILVDDEVVWYVTGDSSSYTSTNPSFYSIDLQGNYSVLNALEGDLNFDGDVNYLDAMTVLRYDAELVTLTSKQLSAGDVNNDGSVNSLDAILILRYDAGLIESFE